MCITPSQAASSTALVCHVLSTWHKKCGRLQARRTLDTESRHSKDTDFSSTETEDAQFEWLSRQHKNKWEQACLRYLLHKNWA